MESRQYHLADHNPNGVKRDGGATTTAEGIAFNCPSCGTHLMLAHGPKVSPDPLPDTGPSRPRRCVVSAWYCVRVVNMDKSIRYSQAVAGQVPLLTTFKGAGLRDFEVWATSTRDARRQVVSWLVEQDIYFEGTAGTVLVAQ